MYIQVAVTTVLEVLPVAVLPTVHHQETVYAPTVVERDIDLSLISMRHPVHSPPTTIQEAIHVLFVVVQPITIITDAQLASAFNTCTKVLYYPEG